MEIDPHAVIEPCSAMLQRSDLSEEQRGVALLVRGRAYHRTRRVPLAVIDYDEALKFIPKNDELLLSRANAAFRLDRPAQGSRFLTKAYNLNPWNPRILRMIGDHHLMHGRSDAAVDYLSRALAIDPSEPYALLSRSSLYSNRREFERAFRDADALIAIKPDMINRQGYLDEFGRMRDFHIVALAHRGLLFEKVGKFDLAEQDVEAAVVYKRSGEALVARAAFLMDRPGREQAALADLEAAIELDPGYMRGFYLKGAMLMQLGQFQDAFGAFDRAHVLEPEYDYALWMRARMHRALGRPEAAADDIERAIALSPRVAEAMMKALRNSGYWNSRHQPDTMTPAFHDAIKACMLDIACN